MALTVTYSHAHFPSSTFFDVYGLGLFQNGIAKILTASEETKFTGTYGSKVNVRNTGDGHFTITGTALT